MFLFVPNSRFIHRRLHIKANDSSLKSLYSHLKPQEENGNYMAVHESISVPTSNELKIVLFL